MVGKLWICPWHLEDNLAIHDIRVHPMTPLDMHSLEGRSCQDQDLDIFPRRDRYPYRVASSPCNMQAPQTRWKHIRLSWSSSKPKRTNQTEDVDFKIQDSGLTFLFLAYVPNMREY